ncbi:MAG: sigma-70 family RNA polymerase sigma factor [Pirellulales bacterium]
MTLNKPRSGEQRDTGDRGVDAQQWLHDHGDALYRYARLRVARRELAEDLVQDTFLAAIQARRPFRGDSNVRTWLISILRRKIVDHYRKRSTTPDAETDSACSTLEHLRIFADDGRWRMSPAPWQTPCDLLENREFWDVFQACLAKLPARLASTFLLREFPDLQVGEPADSFAPNASNVRVRLHRARLSLRECLERNWFGEQRHKRRGVS